MIEHFNSETQTQTASMDHLSVGTIITIFFKNVLWLLALAFYPVIDYIIVIVPDWKENLENFKLIGGAIIVLLVIIKLIFEIIKLIKKII